MTKKRAVKKSRNSVNKTKFNQVKKRLKKKIKQWNNSKTLKTIRPYSLVVCLSLIIFLIFLSVILPKDRFQKAKEALAQNPNDFDSHLILAEEFLKNNQVEEAEKELFLAQKIQPNNYQLQELINQKQIQNPKDIKKLIVHWEKIIKQKPNYRDGYLQLALLHYKLYQNEEARRYLEEALVIDPNFKSAKELKKILGY